MKKQRSITSIMTIIFAATILVQVIILLSIVYIGKVPQKIREQSYKNFDKNITESRTSVYNIIDSKLKYYLHIEEINNIFKDGFGSLDDVVSSSKEKQLKFLENSVTHLIKLIDNTDSNGAYIILENNNEVVDNRVVKRIIYIKEILIIWV